jgi:hypothetical protein
MWAIISSRFDELLCDLVEFGEFVELDEVVGVCFFEDLGFYGGDRAHGDAELAGYFFGIGSLQPVMEDLQLAGSDRRKGIDRIVGPGSVPGGNIVPKKFPQDRDGIFRLCAFIDEMLDAERFEGIVIDIVSMHGEDGDVQLGMVLFYRRQNVYAASIGQIDVEDKMGVLFVVQFLQKIFAARHFTYFRESHVELTKEFDPFCNHRMIICKQYSW